MTNFETQAITHAPLSVWTSHTDIVECYLKDGSTTKPIKIRYEESGKIIDLKSIDPQGEPKENFSDILEDIREFVGYSYKDWRGLFTVSIQ